MVTFTDVTEARRVAQKLAKAIDEAAELEARAHDILQKERRRQKEAKMLGRLDELLQSCKTLTELFEIVQTFTAKLLPQTRGELLESACNWGQQAALAQMAPDGCLALRRGRSSQFEPNALSFLCDHVRGQGHKGDAPYICVPIIVHGDTVGLLHIQFDLGRVEHDIIEPQSFAMAIANVKLRDELHA